MRRDATPAERVLWAELRRAKLEGTRFRRQVPIGRYVADFACHQSCLVIELDGSGHSYDRQLARDSERTSFLAAKGYTVLRFGNDDVLCNSRDVIDRIISTIRMKVTSCP